MATTRMMLMNAIREDELRVAIMSNNKLLDFDYDRPTKKQQKGDIIYAQVKHVEASLDAAFVDTGAPSGRHGFLPFKEVATSNLTQSSDPDNIGNVDDTAPEQKSGLGIKNVVKVDDKILVQIDKDERGKKGAALTTYISLAGCYLVLMPNNPKAGGISRRVEGDERSTLKEAISQLNLPDEMGLIVRTAGVGRSLEELQWDLDLLLKQWEAIQEAIANDIPTPTLIHKESDIVIRAIRDYLRRDIDRIIIDNQEVYDRVKQHVSVLRPDYLEKIDLYTDKTPLFSRYQVEKQIESAYEREVRLPSGGSIVIDHTEALVSIDINSSKSTKGGDIEETAFHTNLEAADEIATQLRLRDSGGLVVIDFIDMSPMRHQREVENRLREALKIDRARVQIGRISRFGLLEMSRQRLRPSIEESNQVVCPRCQGQGSIRSIESLSMTIMRMIEEECMRPSRTTNPFKIMVQLPVDVATYLSNERRENIQKLETDFDTKILLVPNPNFESPQYEITRLTLPSGGKEEPSYKAIEETKHEVADIHAQETHVKRAEPMVKHVLPDMQPKSSGILKRLFGKLLPGQGITESTSEPSTSKVQPSRGRGHRKQYRQKTRGKGGRPKEKPQGKKQYAGGRERDDTRDSSRQHKKPRHTHKHHQGPKRDSSHQPARDESFTKENLPKDSSIDSSHQPARDESFTKENLPKDSSIDSTQNKPLDQEAKKGHHAGSGTRSYRGGRRRRHHGGQRHHRNNNNNNRNFDPPNNTESGFNSSNETSQYRPLMDDTPFENNINQQADDFKQNKQPPSFVDIDADSFADLFDNKKETNEDSKDK